jgi:capping protein alpha
MAALVGEQDAGVTAEERVAIASQLLLSSPPGEIAEVLAELRVLCGEVLKEDVLRGVFRQYNNLSGQVVVAGDGAEQRGLILDQSALLDSEHYMDFMANKVVKVDARRQVVVEADAGAVAPVALSAELAERRSAVEARVQEYVQAQFVKGTAVANVVAQPDDGNLVVLISGEKLNLKNYWSGRWTTKLIVNVAKAKVTGVIKLRIHYFEDGNVQMTTDKTVLGVPIAFSDADADSLGQAVAACVADQESAVQDSLEEMYVNMSKETFKDMRRVLPITRQKMDWSGAQLQLSKGFAGAK